MALRLKEGDRFSDSQGRKLQICSIDGKMVILQDRKGNLRVGTYQNLEILIRRGDLVKIGEAEWDERN